MDSELEELGREIHACGKSTLYYSTRALQLHIMSSPIQRWVQKHKTNHVKDFKPNYEELYKHHHDAAITCHFVMEILSWLDYLFNDVATTSSRHFVMKILVLLVYLLNDVATTMCSTSIPRSLNMIYNKTRLFSFSNGKYETRRFIFSLRRLEFKHPKSLSLGPTGQTWLVRC